MNKEELEEAQKLIDTPITAENVNDPVVAVFPQRSEIMKHEFEPISIQRLKLDYSGKEFDEGSLPTDVLVNITKNEDDGSTTQLEVTREEALYLAQQFMAHWPHATEWFGLKE